MKKAEQTLASDSGAGFVLPAHHGVFTGTRNPRQIRAILAMYEHRILGVSREHLDRICGASNSPEIIRILRQKGLEIEMVMLPAKDRDGRPIEHGQYLLTGADQLKILEWLAREGHATD